MDNFDPKSHWEKILTECCSLQGTGYRTLGQNYNTWLYKIKLKAFIRTIKSLNIEHLGKLDVLDVGSGTGFFINAWKNLHVKSVTGFDITSVAIKHLKWKFPDDKFYQADISDTIMNSEQLYDIVSSFDVIYHIVDDDRYRRAIENIYDLLRPEGYFIFSDNFLHNRTVRGLDQVSRSLEDIERILQKSGFEIVSRAPEFVIMNNPIDSHKLGRFLWLAISLPVEKSERFGSIVGACLYPIESYLISVLKESPTTEIMVCRK